MSRFWKSVEWWPGETFFLVGGGPSLKGMDLSGLKGRKVIAVNNAYSLVPDANILFFADTRWWRWHEANLDGWQGQIISTCKIGESFKDPRILRMDRDYRYHSAKEGVATIALADEREKLSGPDSGYMAINLAYHLGASRIVLLGYDMGFSGGEAHWHPDHDEPTQETNYTKLFAPYYPALVDTLAKRGVEVIRSTPSRLNFIPEVSLPEALALPNRQRG